MSDDMVIHFASNSSNQSDQSLPTKIAKLEARMVGKASSTSTSQATSWSAPAKFGLGPGPADNVAELAVSSDSDDDDNNGREFLIQANTQKRRKLEDDNSSTSFEHVETAADTVKKIVDNTDTSKVGSDVNRRKQSRVKGQTNSGRGRGSRVSDQTKSQAVSVSNGQLENSCQKLQDGLPKEQIGHDRQTLIEEEITSLRAKVVALEEELKKSRQEASDYQHQCQQLEKELKDLKDYEQQTKPKVCFISCFTSFGWSSSVSALEIISIVCARNYLVCAVASLNLKTKEIYVTLLLAVSVCLSPNQIFAESDWHYVFLKLYSFGDIVLV
ncbi:serinethreonine-protein kinase tousled [Nicotiana attenuata]|uniref:Serinethreonine-protein kinase tousled n=1 Tax=Nicotiana attenuata TaxID=49451 RepID=A0A1J6IQ09_NICAT|nr:serinethreonine-protein kinase tousled [Nicotiana attenuata]